MAEKLTHTIVNLTDLGNKEQQEVAESVADYTRNVGHEQHKMLELSPDQVLSRMGRVAYVNGEMAGYIGAGLPEDGPYGAMSEVGSLFVSEKYQRRGIAISLMNAAVNGLNNNKVVPYVFCNDNSLPVAQAVGFEIAGTSEVPACATEACSGCKIMQAGLVKPGQCCDTIMVHKGEAGK